MEDSWQSNTVNLSQHPMLTFALAALAQRTPKARMGDKCWTPQGCKKSTAEICRCHFFVLFFAQGTFIMPGYSLMPEKLLSQHTIYKRASRVSMPVLLTAKGGLIADFFFTSYLNLQKCVPNHSPEHLLLNML